MSKRYGIGAAMIAALVASSMPASDAREKLRYDLYYIKNMSVALDIFVMFQTVKTVLLRRGAS